MSILLLATDRGIWRRDYAPGIELRKEDFHVDAPGDAALAISGRGQQAVVWCDEGRMLVWDHEARLFREEAAPEEIPVVAAEGGTAAEGRADDGARGDSADEGLELEDLGVERIHLGRSGARYLGCCPPAVIRVGAEGDWAALGDLRKLPGAEDWRGLESPYEARVTALLERPTPGAGTPGDGARARAATVPDLYATVSVGGLLRRRAEVWESVAPSELPRDLRTLAWAHERLWLGGGQGLWWMTPDPFECRRASLPPSAGFVSQIVALPGAGLLVAAAGGPPATWRGPDGSRMSIWHFADDAGVGRPIAGPFHGVLTGMAFDGEAVLASTDDGELWRAPLSGPVPQEPLFADLPRVNGLFLVDAAGSGG